MGVELVLGGLSLITGIIGGVAQAGAINDAAAAQKKANSVQAAQTEINSLEDQRQRIREDRIRRANIIAASTNQGSNGSSGEAGALSSLDTNLASIISNSRFNSTANDAVNKYSQESVDASNRSNLIKSIQGTVENSINTVGTIFEKPKTSGNIFGG